MDDQDISIHSNDPSQQDEAVKKVAQNVGEILTRDEQVLYVCMQNFNAGPMKKSIVATTRRLIYFEPQIFGRFNFRDYPWQDILDAQLNQGMISSEMTVRLMGGQAETLGNLDKDQARRMYSICQQQEDEWRERRRVRQLEEDRARSGGVIVQSGGAPAGATAPAPTPAPEDPVERLAKAKSLLDRGLISEEEFNAVKTRILENL